VGLKKHDFYNLRGKHVGLVPQDPMHNLNPVYKIGNQVKEAIRVNAAKKLPKDELKKLTVERLQDAGLKNVDERMNAYPHEFSGGMLQRTLIAIGISAHPELLIADEPTSALDVTVQKQILDHLELLTNEMGIATLFVTHDLGLAAERSEKIIVMHNGVIVESGKSLDILKNPKHSYTKKLIAAAPSIKESSKKLKPISHDDTVVLDIKNLKLEKVQKQMNFML
jgi:peptide/nickel transport system ATP-binding protein